MPRWLQITLTLLIYAAGMAVVAWIVGATVLGFSAWLGSVFGEVGATVLVFGTLIPIAIFAYWPSEAGRDDAPASFALGLKQ